MADEHSVTSFSV